MEVEGNDAQGGKMFVGFPEVRECPYFIALSENQKKEEGGQSQRFREGKGHELVSNNKTR